MKQEKPRKIWIAILILIVLFLISTAIAGVINLFTNFSGEEIEEEGNVALIPIKGVIVADEETPFLGTSGTASSTKIIKQLEEAAADEEIKAIILEINSPGGSPVAADEVTQAIKEIKINKTVVAWIREMGASAAYFIASGTNYTVAGRMSLTGSIGVMGSYLEYADLLTRFNVTYRRLVSGKYKDAGTPYRRLTAEEESLIQERIDAMHSIFIEEVAENRHLNAKDVRKIATGMVYLGAEAKELGLIDVVGGKKEAVEYLEKALNTTIQVKEYKEKKNILELLRQLQSQGQSVEALTKLLMLDQTPLLVS